MLRLRAENRKYEWGRNRGTIPSLYWQMQPLNREIKHRLATPARTAEEIKYPQRLLAGSNYFTYRVFAPLFLAGLQVHHFWISTHIGLRASSLKQSLYSQEQNFNFIFPFYKPGRGSLNRLSNFIATCPAGGCKQFLPRLHLQASAGSLQIHFGDQKPIVALSSNELVRTFG